MDTQSASVHIRLWHKNFWLLIIVNLLLCISVTMLIPTMPRWLLLKDGIARAYGTIPEIRKEFGGKSLEEIFVKVYGEDNA